jgi:asparagine synthase (glutamine-hydrolysing)
VEVQRDRPLADEVSELHRLVHQAVERQLVADVPVGVLLSGGIDSSIVAQAAVEVSGSPIATFSIGFEDPTFDESSYFNAVAEAVGSEQHTEILSPATLIDMLPSISTVACEPLADGSIFPMYLLARFASKEVKVALSGDGSDELFAGYPTYQAVSIGAAMSRLPAAVRRGLLAVAQRVLPVDYSNISFDFKVKKLLAGLHPDPVLRNMRWLGTFLPEQLPDLLCAHQPSHQAALELLLHEPSQEAPTPLQRMLRTDERFYMQDQVLVKVDRAAMASSLEVRVPFLDNDLVAFAHSVPDRHKLRGWDVKHLLKAYAAGRLPPEVVARPKKGFGTPLGKWFRRELKGLLREVLSQRRLEEQGLFRPSFVARLLAEHWDGRGDRRKELFSLLTFCLWHETLGSTEAPCSAEP